MLYLTMLTSIPAVTNVAPNTDTDWWMFAATIGAGILSALVTWFAVVYTNKKTAASYEKELERHAKNVRDCVKKAQWSLLNQC